MVRSKKAGNHVKLPSEENKDADVDLSAYKQLFLEQALTFLTLFRKSLVQLKDDPEDDLALREARRASHTLKGMASTMRYEALTEIAERLERPFLLESPPSPDRIGVLMAGCDEFESGLEGLQSE
jgi:two-component system chemotaxis sensor kinase CheA